MYTERRIRKKIDFQSLIDSIVTLKIDATEQIIRHNKPENLCNTF